MKDVKTNIKKLVKVGLIVGAAYVAGRITCFKDMVNKYKDNINVDEINMGFFSATNDIAGIAWIRSTKED